MSQADPDEGTLDFNLTEFTPEARGSDCARVEIRRFLSGDLF